MLHPVALHHTVHHTYPAPCTHNHPPSLSAPPCNTFVTHSQLQLRPRRLFQLFPSHPLPLVFLHECVIAMTILRISPLPNAFAQIVAPESRHSIEVRICHINPVHRVDPSVVVLAYTYPRTAFIQHHRDESSLSLCVPCATTFLTRPPSRTPRSIPIPLPFSNTQPKLVHKPHSLANSSPPSFTVA